MNTGYQLDNHFFYFLVVYTLLNNKNNIKWKEFKCGSAPWVFSFAFFFLLSFFGVFLFFLILFSFCCVYNFLFQIPLIQGHLIPNKHHANIGILVFLLVGSNFSKFYKKKDNVFCTYCFCNTSLHELHRIVFSRD